MEVFRWPSQSCPLRRDSVATLGIFDGVHVGHAEILKAVVREAAQRGLTPVAVSFDRHPASVLRGSPEPLITSLPHRLRLFDRLGIQCSMIVEFTRRVAAMEAEEFARTVFGDILRVRLLILGFDCRFGKDRRGDAELCSRLGAGLGFAVKTVGPVEVRGQVVSSTAIRRAIAQGDLELARQLLGRPYSVLGTVVRGDDRGHAVGFPTANLDLHHELVPPCGVYAVRILLNGESLHGVLSVGRRETFHPEPHAPVAVEVHLLDQQRDLYGKDLEVQLVELIRPQQRFNSAEELVRQIQHDVATARNILSQSDA